MMTDEELAAEYQERAQTLRKKAGGVTDDKRRADLIREADECAAVAWELAPHRRLA